MEKKTFWMVWSPQGRAPTYQHTTLAQAAGEAERLARENPGTRFHVLEMIGTCSTKSISWDYVDPNGDLACDRDIPF